MALPLSSRAQFESRKLWLILILGPKIIPHQPYHGAMLFYKDSIPLSPLTEGVLWPPGPCMAATWALQYGLFSVCEIFYEPHSVWGLWSGSIKTFKQLKWDMNTLKAIHCWERFISNFERHSITKSLKTFQGRRWMTFHHLQKAFLFFPAVANHCQPPWEPSSLPLLVLTTRVSHSQSAQPLQIEKVIMRWICLTVCIWSVDINLSLGSWRPAANIQWHCMGPYVPSLWPQLWIISLPLSAWIFGISLVALCWQ